MSDDLLHASVVRATGVLLAATFVGGVSLTGCAPREPPRAVMVPQVTAGDYGYSETQLAPDRFRITYVTLSLRIRSAGDRAAVLEGERSRAYDLALWRAAQVALDHGFPAFAVERDNRDADLTVQRERSYPVWPYPCFPGRHCWPYWHPNDWYYERYRERSHARITVTLIVQMRRAPTTGAFDAASTERRLRAAYATATYPGHPSYD